MPNPTPRAFPPPSLARMLLTKLHPGFALVLLSRSHSLSPQRSRRCREPLRCASRLLTNRHGGVGRSSHQRSFVQTFAAVFLPRGEDKRRVRWGEVFHPA